MLDSCTVGNFGPIFLRVIVLDSMSHGGREWSVEPRERILADRTKGFSQLLQQVREEQTPFYGMSASVFRRKPPQGGVFTDEKMQISGHDEVFVSGRRRRRANRDFRL